MGLRGGRGGHRPRTAAGDVVADRVAGLRGSTGCRCRQSHRIVAEDVASVDVAAQPTAAVPAWTWRRHGMSPWTWLRGQPRGMSRRPRPWEGGAVCEDMDGHDGRHLRGHSRGTAVGMSLLTRAWGEGERKPATTDESTGRPRNTSPLWTWPRRRPQGMSLRTRPSKGGGAWVVVGEALVQPWSLSPPWPWLRATAVEDTTLKERGCRMAHGACLQAVAGKLLQRSHVAQEPLRFCRCGRRELWASR